MHSTFISQLKRPLTAGILLPVFLVLALAACKKDKNTDPEVPKAGSEAQMIADSLFLYAKDIYLWNDQLPSYDAFQPRKYVDNDASDVEAGLNKEMIALAKYAKNGSGYYEYQLVNGQEWTKYSYIFDTDETNPDPVAYTRNDLSAVNLEGVGYDFGIRLGVYVTRDYSNFQLKIIAVYPGSPAAALGIRRGDIITSLNGKAMSGVYNGTVSDYIDAAVDDKAEVNLSIANKPAIAKITRASYRSSPVLKDTVVTVSGQQVGYLAFARFSSLSFSRQYIDAAFKKFSGVSSLVVDLRLNGGGYVQTCEYLTNLIAPPAAAGSVMFAEHFNSTLQNKKATMPYKTEEGKYQYRNGKVLTFGDLDFTVAGNTTKFAATAGQLSGIKRIVFIVSDNTASASELLINSLKPLSGIDIKLIGENTYGKPVGFAPVRLGKYDVYLSMFESKNAKGEGGYYNGMSVDLAQADYAEADFGTLADGLSLYAYYYAGNGTFPSTGMASTKEASAARFTPVKEISGAGKDFKGMIETRFKIK